MTPAAEPATFHDKVRVPGAKWLADENLTGVKVAPTGKTIKAIWRKCIPDLQTAYGDVCAYASLRLPPVVSATSVEHFIPKSVDLTLAYEWSNYRLVCSRMNSRKREFVDVLDPFTLAPDTFHLNVGNGRIVPAPHLVGPELEKAKATIRRLKLDHPVIRKRRQELIDDYLEDHLPDRLKRESPFLWSELTRQGMIPPPTP